MKLYTHFFYTISIILFCQIEINAQKPDRNWWIPGGLVNSIASDGTYTYIGGQFSYVGPNTGGGAMLSTTSTSPDLNYPIITGTVFCVVKDGSGGWYIGGQFLKVGDSSRISLAHILSDGSIDPLWTPKLNYDGLFLGTVNSIEINGSDLYVAGSFTSISGIERNNLAKINATTGVVDVNWNPNANNFVHHISSDGSAVYVGGGFTNVGGQPRNYIAKLNNTTGVADASWNPNANNVVNTIALNGSDVYVGGTFTNIGGLAKTRMAKLNNSTGVADVNWSAAANGTVFSIKFSGTDTYVGGGFNFIAGLSRRGLAKLNTTNGNVDLTWNPSTSDIPESIKIIEINGTNVYVGGSNGSSINSINRIVKLNNTTGASDPTWKPLTQGFIEAISVNGGDVYVGGTLISIGGREIANLARLNNLTGVLDFTWNPGLDGGTVNSIAISGNEIYAGGNFGIPNPPNPITYNIAKINKTTGALDSTWKPSVVGTITSIVLNGQDIYVGGDFTSIGGQPRNNIAKLNSTNGNADASWNPDASSHVNSIAISGNDMYIGGNFKLVSGITRNHLAKLNLNTGALDALWNPNVTNVSTNLNIKTIALSDSSVFVGGYFRFIGSKAINRAAKLNNLTGAVDPAWNANITDNPGAAVHNITLNNSDVYIGGTFTLANGPSTLIRVNVTDGIRSLTWDPNPSGLVYTMQFTENSILLGGGFDRMNEVNQRSFARFPIYSAPIINAGSATIFCSGGSVTLTSNAANGNQWYKDGTVINGASTTTLIVTSAGSYTSRVIIDGNQSNFSNPIVVTVNPNPPTPSITQNGTQLTSSATSGNQWHYNNVLIPGATNQNHTPTSSGGYKVQVTVNNCPSDFSNTINFIVTDLLDLSLFSSQIKIFPTPVHDKLIIRRTVNNVSTINIRLFDMTGREMKRTNSSSLQTEMDMKGLPSGNYVLWVEDKANKISGKKMIVKQ